MDQILETTILSQYLRQAALGIKGVISKHEEYQFKCNICGDSKTNSLKKRGALRLYKGPGIQYWTYKCFNDGCKASGKAWKGSDWLKYTAPHLYDQYESDLLSDCTSDNSKEIKLLEEKLKIENRRLKKEKKDKEEVALEYFIPITDNNRLCEIAIKLCKDRHIPEEIWKDFFVALPGKGSIYANRMIIPFYNNEGEIYYWQARSLLKDQEPKYLNRLTEKDEAVYNIYNIDPNKPVFVTEGPIDSMFLDNAVATLGVSISKDMQNILDKFKEVIYVFDGDEAGFKSAKKYIELGKTVFLWKEFIKDLNLPSRNKWDINDVIIYNDLKNIKFDYEMLSTYISKSYYDMLFT